jgi:hypothetical protein
MPGGSRSPHFVVARARQRSGGRGHGAHDHAEVFAPVALGALDQEWPELIALDSASGPDQSVISSFETAVLPAPIGPEMMVIPASLCPVLMMREPRHAAQSWGDQSAFDAQLKQSREQLRVTDA